MRALLVALLLLPGCLSPDVLSGEGEVPKMNPDDDLLAHLEALANGTMVRFETDAGDITVLFYDTWMPITTSHILALVEDGFYDGLPFHRVVDDFVIQTGDPTGTGEGGSGPAGTSDMIPLEIHEGLQFGSGALGLARWTDDTGDSQFFITEKPAPHLHDPQGTTGDVFGAYALFAQVVDGMDVVRSIASVPVVPGADRPIEDVLIQRAVVVDEAFDPLAVVVDVTEPFDAWGARGASLEVPRFAVVDHPIHIRLHATPDDGDCPASAGEGNGWISPGIEPERIDLVFEPTVDPCTFEATVTATWPGPWTVSGHDAPRDGILASVSVQVLAHHEDYEMGESGPRSSE